MHVDPPSPPASSGEVAALRALSDDKRSPSLRGAPTRWVLEGPLREDGAGDQVTLDGVVPRQKVAPMRVAVPERRDLEVAVDPEGRAQPGADQVTARVDVHPGPESVRLPTRGVLEEEAHEAERAGEGEEVRHAQVGRLLLEIEEGVVRDHGAPAVGDDRDSGVAAGEGPEDLLGLLLNGGAPTGADEVRGEVADVLVHPWEPVEGAALPGCSPDGGPFDRLAGCGAPATPNGRVRWPRLADGRGPRDQDRLQLFADLGLGELLAPAQPDRCPVPASLLAHRAAGRSEDGLPDDLDVALVREGQVGVEAVLPGGRVAGLMIADTVNP